MLGSKTTLMVKTLDDRAVPLKPVYEGDCGIDLPVWPVDDHGKPVDNLIIMPQMFVWAPTGLSIKVDTGTWGMIRPRSSTFLKRKLFVMEGTIDSGYTGPLFVCVWNPNPYPITVTAGDSLAQLIPVPMFSVYDITTVMTMPHTQRGEAGFGSTGKVTLDAGELKHEPTDDGSAYAVTQLLEYPSGDVYKGQHSFGKIISVDLDGVIMKYEGWKGPDVFGEVIDGAASTLHALKDKGWYIAIFTTRLVTEKLVDYLRNNGIPFDDINGRIHKGKVLYQHYGERGIHYGVPSPRHYWRHNPADASIKPIASVYVDDMSWENGGKQYTYSKWMELYANLIGRFGT